jgi:hypothetical protein
MYITPLIKDGNIRIKNTMTRRFFVFIVEEK